MTAVAGGQPSGLRVGQGYDLHRLVAGRPLILGGVVIPYTEGLLGHSDADVVLHALTDALLGAAGLGDIGDWFSDCDPRYAGADSGKLLQTAFAAVQGKGWCLINADLTIIAERPKLGPYKVAIAERIAELLAVDQTQINIKAKTNEGLDAVGSGAAIAVHAVVLLSLPVVSSSVAFDAHPAVFNSAD